MEMMSPSIKEIAKAISVAQAKITNAKKDKLVKVVTATKGTYTYKYTELPDCLEIIKLPLAESELAFIQMPHHDEKLGSVLVNLILHSSGEWIKSVYSLKTSGGNDRNEMQSLGSAITFLRRYCLCAIWGIGSEDDDGASATSKAPSSAKANAEEEWGVKLVNLCRAYGIDAKDFAKRFKITTQQIESVKAAVQNFQTYLDLYNNPNENNEPIKEDTLP